MRLFDSTKQQISRPHAIERKTMPEKWLYLLLAARWPHTAFDRDVQKGVLKEVDLLNTGTPVMCTLSPGECR